MDLKRICLYMILPPLLVSCGLSGGSSLEEDPATEPRLS